VAAIAASAGEQATGLAEVNGAVNQMDQVTQQNAAMVEETTAASHTLAREADALSSLVARFNLGSAAPAAEIRPARPSRAAPAPAARKPAAPPVRLVSRGGALPAARSAPVEDGWEEF
jgi:methyl-accepting chemotaxis protein